MAKVTLDFIPPGDPNIAALVIYESGSATGPFTQIERTTAVGPYPDYITRYTTTLAAQATDWFTIAWENTDGIVGPMSAPWQGGTTSLVQKIIDRVRDRDASLRERVVAQEAEGTIQYVLGENVDPYDPSLSVTYRQMNGLVYLVMARSYVQQAVTTNSGALEQATMGLVSFRNSTSASSRQVDVSALIDMANRDLGIATSVIMQLEDMEFAPYQSFDISRLTSGWVSIEP